MSPWTMEDLRIAIPSMRPSRATAGRPGKSPGGEFRAQPQPPAVPMPQDLRAESESGNTVLMGKTQQTVLEAAGREVVITNPDKVFFAQAGHTKLDLARYYAAVAEGALRGIAARPIVLKRYVHGAEREPFFQKRDPQQHPEWVETAGQRFPSGPAARPSPVADPL